MPGGGNMQNHLRQMVERSSAELLKRQDNTNEGLLFLGNPHLAFPRLLYEDPVLEPVDRNVWAAIKLHASDGQMTAFPTYDELCLRCNVKSKGTIARSLAILRAMRWLTVCVSKLRDKRGRVRGSIYALHDEPLQLADTLELDSNYLDWLREAANNHYHNRVKAVAGIMLAGMQDRLHQGIDITAPESPTARRQQSLESIQLLFRQGLAERKGKALPDSDKAKLTNMAFFGANAFSIHAMNQNQSLLTTEKSPEADQVQSLNPVPEHPETVLAPSSTIEPSCSFIELRNSSNNKNTTTTTHAKPPDTTDYPVQLDQNSRALVRMQLATLPENLRQGVLDALAAKLDAISRGISKPLSYGVLPYTRKLCELAMTGRLNPIPKPEQGNHTSADTNTELKLLMNEMSILVGDIRHAEMMLQASGYEDPQLADKRQRYFVLKKRADEIRNRGVHSVNT
jgi:hypothetical protein